MSFARRSTPVVLTRQPFTRSFGRSSRGRPKEVECLRKCYGPPRGLDGDPSLQGLKARHRTIESDR